MAKDMPEVATSGGEILSELCFNATSVATDPSPAFIFRDAERNCGTQLLTRWNG